MITRKKSIRGAFGTSKQAAYGTKYPDTAFTAAHPYDGNMIEFTVDKWDDKDQVGGVSEFGSRIDNTTCSTSGNMTFDMSSFIAGFGTAFTLGNVTTTQPDDVGSPNVYSHESIVADIDNPAIGNQLPSFSYIEQLRSDKKTLYRDMVVKSMAISGQSKEQLKMALELIGSGYWEDSTATMPGLVSTSFLRFADLVITYGGTDISPLIKDFNFKFTNELAEDLGYHPGSGYLTANPGAPQIRGHCLTKGRAVEMSFKMLIEDFTMETNMLNNTQAAITVTATGSTIENTYKHSLIIECPNTILRATKRGEDGFLTFDCEVAVLYDEGIASPFKITVQNDVPSYLTTAA